MENKETLLPLEELRAISVNSATQKKRLIAKTYRNLIKRRRIKHLILCILSLGYRCFYVKQKASVLVNNELAKRKLKNLKKMSDVIETLRNEVHPKDPREQINEIFMKVQTVKNEESEQGIEFKKIYSPNEILLCITSPLKEGKMIKRPRALKGNEEHSRSWRELRKTAKEKQFYYIDHINTCNTILREEYNLSITDISDRLERTKIAKTSRSSLTKLKELLKAFQEIVASFQEFDDLVENEKELHQTLLFFKGLAPDETELIEHYLRNEHLPKDLPLRIRKTVIALSNQSDILQKIQEKQLAHMCELILSTKQWNTFLLAQNPSDSTLKLLDWAYHETCAHTPHNVSFIDAFRSCTLITESDPLYKEITEAGGDSLKGLCSFFAGEVNREWPSVLLYDQKKEVYFTDRCDSTPKEKVIELFTALKKLTGDAPDALLYLQGALSNSGKEILQKSLQGKLTELLGEAPVYFIPVFTIVHIAITKESDTTYRITYYFKCKVFKKGEQNALSQSNEDIPIHLTLTKKEMHWSAHLSEHPQS